MAERTWPEGEEPTPEQWVDWFLAHDREGQERLAEKAIQVSRESLECFVRHGEIGGEYVIACVKCDLLRARAEALAEGLERLPEGVVIDVREEVTGPLRALLDGAAS